ncbi:MAG: beta-galactosidase, partial [Trebonia sp.]
VSRGARMIEYWHWNTLRSGTETYWGGILPHNGRPGRTYHELSRLGREFARAGSLLDGMIPDADVAMVFSLPSRWVMERHPPLGNAAGGPDTRAYQGLFEPFYRGAFDAGLQVRILHPSQFGSAERAARDFPVLVASGLYVADDETLEWLRAYALSGGHLVLGPRTGYADQEACARADRMPARLADIAGASYDEYSNVASTVRVVSGELLPVPEDAAATRWIDGLLADDATILARYDHPHFRGWAAITTRAVGDGRVTCVGTVPGQTLAEAVLRWACPVRHTPWRQVPASVTSTGATAADGRRLRFLHNWCWQPVTVTAPVACQDVLSGKPIAAGDDIALDSWDVRALAQE